MPRSQPRPLIAVAGERYIYPRRGIEERYERWRGGGCRNFIYIMVPRLAFHFCQDPSRAQHRVTHYDPYRKHEPTDFAALSFKPGTALDTCIRPSIRLSHLLGQIITPRGKGGCKEISLSDNFPPLILGVKVRDLAARLRTPWYLKKTTCKLKYMYRYFSHHEYSKFSIRTRWSL